MFSSSTSTTSTSGEKDPVKEAEDLLRHGRRGVAYGEAKLELPAGESTHVEYFRAKDLVRWIENNPDKLSRVLKAGAQDLRVQGTSCGSVS